MMLWLVLVALIVGLSVFRYKRRRMYKLASLVPAPGDEHPVMGIAHKLTGSTEDIMMSLQRYSYDSIKEDGIIRGWLGHILYFVVVNPVDLEMVLKTCMEKDNLHRFLRKVIGYGGIFAPVSIWRRRRKILVPAFSPKIVETFVEVFSEQSEKLARRLSCRANTGPFSIWPYISTYTLDSVCETAMGVKINAQDNPNSPFLTAMNKVLNLVCERIFHLWLQPDWLYKLFPQYTEHQKCLQQLHSFTNEAEQSSPGQLVDYKLAMNLVCERIFHLWRQPNWLFCFHSTLSRRSVWTSFIASLVIRKKREEIKAEKQSCTEADKEYDLLNYRRKCFLDLLITLSGGEKGYSDEELREETLTLTIAGTDTSAVAVGYTLKLLGKYPDIQDKVYQELQDVFGDSERPLVKEDLMNLKYLERVVKESLRLFPPVPFVIRKVLEDTKLPASGHTLPAGSGVVVSIWGVHRDPRYWGPDAEHFDPDRFLPERFKLAHACSYMPFSNGPRNCVGYQYALMSIKTSLAAILRRYRVVAEQESGPIPHIRVKLDIMMKATDGYQLALERRKPEKLTSNGRHVS